MRGAGLEVIWPQAAAARYGRDALIRADDAAQVGEIAIIKRVAEHSLQEVVVALAGLPGQ